MSKQPKQGKKHLVVPVIILTAVVVITAYSGLFNFRKDNSSGPEKSTSQERSTSNPAMLQTPGKPDSKGVFHVWPGMSIQEALDAAAAHPEHKTVKVHEGTYRPQQHGQAMIWLNSQHEGITLLAEGEVILTAENPEIADSSLASYPAVVNHVVYFGDGISRSTVIRGFKITGANHYVTRSENPVIQPPVDLPRLRVKSFIHYADGGGIKTWGRCYPTIDRCEIYGNYVSPCAGAISIENCGYTDNALLIVNCIFRNNSSQITGSAIDLFGPGNRAEIRNCLFVGNIANRGINFFTFPKPGINEDHGSGALTVFNGSHVTVDGCTFTGNYNGIDDAGTGSTYTNSIFWNNNATGGIAPRKRYEMDVRNAQKVSNCYLGGDTIHDLRGTLRKNNVVDAPDPGFDSKYRPTNRLYANVGYRPVGAAGNYKTHDARLTDQHGNPFSSSQLFGKPWVINFIFTACPSICPAVTENLVQVHRSTNSEQVTFITITVDPENDTSPALLTYAKKMGADHENWKFLTGKRNEIWQLCKEKFRLPVAKGADSKHGIIAHSSKVLLFQSDGSLNNAYEGTSQEDMSKLKNDLQGLLPQADKNDDGYSAHITVPNDFGQTEKWIESRQAKQIASKDEIDAPINFKFNDQQQQSGLNFRHHIVDCAGKHYKAAHYDHGSGIAVADIDGDDLLDVYMVSQFGPSGLYRNLGKGKFADITKTAGVAAQESISVTASFADIDNDGDPDLYLTNTLSPNKLFLNKGDGTFEDASKNSGIDYNEHSSAAVFFDYNNDGLLDLFLCVVGEFTTDELAEVEGTVESHPITGPVPKYRVAFKDAFSGHLKPERLRSSRLFQNTGQGKFKDVTEALGLIDKGWSGAAVPVDFNRDGFQDLYVLNMQGPDSFWENQAGKKFINKSRELFPLTPWGAMGAKSFDHNNDGHMDLYITDMHSDMSRIVEPTEEKEKALWAAEKWGDRYLNDGGKRIFGNAFYKNNGGGAFKEVSDALNMENFWPWGLSVGDLNADGWQDAFVASSMNYPLRYGVNTALINNNGKGFKDAEFILGLEPRKDGLLTTPWFQLDASGADRDHHHARGQAGKLLVVGAKGSRSSAIFDLDNDGDLDIITNEFGDVPQVLMSDLSTGSRPINYIKIKLKGAKSNRDALGARVTVTSGSLTQTQVHDGQSGYLSQSSIPLYFGLGKMEKIDTIEVNWPSGAQTKLSRDLKINGTFEIIESASSK